MVLNEVFQYLFIKASTFCMMVLFVRVFTNISTIAAGGCLFIFHLNK